MWCRDLREARVFKRLCALLCLCLLRKSFSIWCILGVYFYSAFFEIFYFILFFCFYVYYTTHLKLFCAIFFFVFQQFSSCGILWVPCRLLRILSVLRDIMPSIHTIWYLFWFWVQKCNELEGQFIYSVQDQSN